MIIDVALTVGSVSVFGGVWVTFTVPTQPALLMRSSDEAYPGSRNSGPVLVLDLFLWVFSHFVAQVYWGLWFPAGAHRDILGSIKQGSSILSLRQCYNCYCNDVIV